MFINLKKSMAVWYLKIFTALSHQPLLRQQHVFVAESELVNSKGQKINYTECKFSVTARVTQMWVGLLMQSVYNCIQHVCKQQQKQKELHFIILFVCVCVCVVCVLVLFLYLSFYIYFSITRNVRTLFLPIFWINEVSFTESLISFL